MHGGRGAHPAPHGAVLRRAAEGDAQAVAAVGAAGEVREPVPMARARATALGDQRLVGAREPATWIARPAARPSARDLLSPEWETPEVERAQVEVL